MRRPTVLSHPFQWVFPASSVNLFCLLLFQKQDFPIYCKEMVDTTFLWNTMTFLEEKATCDSIFKIPPKQLILIFFEDVCTIKL